MQHFLTRPRIRFLFLVGLVIALVVVVSQQWQRQQFWAGCVFRQPGTDTRSWYQGSDLNFGFPSNWQSAICPSQHLSLKIITGQPGWWRDIQPVGQASITLSNQSVGEQTLPKTLAAWSKEDFNGQRRFSTVSAGNQDGLVRIQISPDHVYTQEVIFDQGQRRYHFLLTFQATSQTQLQAHHLTLDATDTPLNHLLSTLSFQ